MRNGRTRMQRAKARAELLFGIALVVIAVITLIAVVGINTAVAVDTKPTVSPVAPVSELEQFEKEVSKAKSTEPEYDDSEFDEVDYQTEAEPVVAYRYIGKYRVTGYDACVSCCGKTDAITASGVKAEVGRTIAASGAFPFGTVIYIDGIGERVVEDRGGAINGNKIDLFCANHADCYAVTGWYECYIVEEVA